MEPAHISGLMLPKEAIKEFKQIYRQEFGVDLSEEEAQRRANNLMAFYRAVLEEDQPGAIKKSEDLTK